MGDVEGRATVKVEPGTDVPTQTSSHDVSATGTSGDIKCAKEGCFEGVIKEEIVYIKQEPIEAAIKEEVDTDDDMLDSCQCTINSEPETDVIEDRDDRPWLKGDELARPAEHVENSTKELEREGTVISNTSKGNLLHAQGESGTLENGNEWNADQGVYVSRQKVVEPHVCDVCKCVFSKACLLKSHMRTHTGERPFHCDVCDSKFTQAGHLKAHKRIHSGEKPFICDVCKSGFRLLTNLRRHERIHSRVKPYACDVCESRFSQANDLKRHKGIHRGEKPYACDECESRFSRDSHLKRHKRTHTGEKPYACDVCESRFSRLGVLKKHKMIHSQEKPYS